MLYNKKLITIILLFISISASSQSLMLDPAKKIRAVWNLSTQPCNGIDDSNSMIRHKDEKQIKQTKSISINETGFNYKIPQLPDVKETVVKLFLNDKSRGVIDHYFLITDQDLKAPFAAIVVTELPPEFQNIEKAFAAVKTLQNNSARKSGIKINLEEAQGIYGDTLELIIENRIGSHCFPTSTYKFLPKNYKSKTLGISRFALINKKLVEFSLIVNTLDKMNHDESVRYAQRLMDSFWLGLKSNT